MTVVSIFIFAIIGGMAGIKWIVSQLVAGLLLTGTLAAPAPQTPESTSVVAPEPTEGVDLAAQFVQELIINATQAEERQLTSKRKRGLGCKSDSKLVVDLGYARYQGYVNATTGLNNWKGYVCS